MSGLQYCYIASILVVGNHFHTGWLNIQYVPIIAFNRNGISTVHTIIQSFFFSLLHSNDVYLHSLHWCIHKLPTFSIKLYYKLHPLVIN